MPKAGHVFFGAFGHADIPGSLFFSSLDTHYQVPVLVPHPILGTECCSASLLAVINLQITVKSRGKIHSHRKPAVAK